MSATKQAEEYVIHERERIISLGIRESIIINDVAYVITDIKDLAALAAWAKELIPQAHALATDGINKQFTLKDTKGEHYSFVIVTLGGKPTLSLWKQSDEAKTLSEMKEMNMDVAPDKKDEIMVEKIEIL